MIKESKVGEKKGGKGKALSGKIVEDIKEK